MLDGSSAMRSQTDQVVDTIRAMIVDGTFTAGQRLPVEKDLADRLGVSRGSLREGLRALVHLGVLTIRQGSGISVSALSADVLLAPLGFLADVQSGDAGLELHQVRRVLETEAARLAAHAMPEETFAELDAELAASTTELARPAPDHRVVLDHDARFHHLVARGSGNAFLSALVDALSGRTLQARLFRAMQDDGAESHAAVEHAAILDALRRRDAEAAGIRMAVHLLSGEAFLRRAGGSPDPDPSPSTTEEPS